MASTDLLAILPCLPVPLDSGLKLRLHNNLRALGTLGRYRRIHVLALGSAQPRCEKLPAIGDWEAFGDDHSALQAAVQRYYTRSFGIALTLLEDPALYPLVEAVAGVSSGAIVVDMHNIESELALSISQAYPIWRWRRRDDIRRTAARYRAIEDRVLRSPAHIWVCSELDKHTLETRHPGRDRISVVPNIIWDRPEALPPFSPERLTKALYAGTYAYYPNRQAAKFICEKLAPRLEHVPGMQLTLVGSGPKRFMQRAARRHQMLEVTGRVPDMTPYLEACGIQLMPIFRGGGTRLKAIEASLRGLIIVGTAKAVEGLDFQPGTHYLHAESASQFNDGIQRLVGDTLLAETIRHSAFQKTRGAFTHMSLMRVLSNRLRIFDI
ncbi:MAG: glycosyltransferase [Phycisphaerales bacterium]